MSRYELCVVLIPAFETVHTRRSVICLKTYDEQGNCLLIRHLFKQMSVPLLELVKCQCHNSCNSFTSNLSIVVST